TAMVLNTLDRFHDVNPLVQGISKEELRDRTGIGPDVFQRVIAEMIEKKAIELVGDLVRLPGRGVVMKNEEAESKKIIEHAFSSAGLQVPALQSVLGGLKV